MSEQRGRRKRIQFSKIYTFQCGRSSLKEDHSQQGISRVILANKSDGNQNYCDNYVRTSKYTIATFFPKSLFEQFRRVANFYFLVTGIISFTPLAPYSAISAILPLFVVIGATMIKEAVEDWRRAQQDNEVNSRNVKFHEKNGEFVDVEWKHVRVGDVVKVQKDEFFPADLLLISTSYEDGICYVETMNLDGETNLKVKQSLESTLHLQEDSSFKEFEGLVKCEDPNANLYSFIGTMEFQDIPYSLSPLHLLLRDSKLRNTDYIYGVVLFTGHDTKVFQNSTEAPSKRSGIERKMDQIIFVMFGIMFFMALTGSVFFGFLTGDDAGMKRWYLKPDESSVYFDPNRPVVASILHFVTAIVLYSYFIPISLYVSVEVVKVLQCVFINQDVKMYYEEADKPARARTSNLNEELGQVDTILSDKTGTLTCNTMEFIKCSIAGTAYGNYVTDVEKAMESRHVASSPLVKTKPTVKGFNFMDDRITNGMWVNEPNSDLIQKFFQLLAICHTAVPEVDEDTGEVTYEAESPDEAAFVVAAREIGFEFCKRTQSSVSIREFDPVSGDAVERVYKVLNVLEFNSGRKRMSVIVRDEEGRLLLFCKGADSVMLGRLSGCEFKELTIDHVNAYADAGLRTLMLAYRQLTEDEYAAFDKEFTLAKNSLTEDREAHVSHLADGFERDLILLGATAVEDKLQIGVPECIDKLSQAGIKIWILTGDKMETAINIGFACSLLRQGMKQIVIHLADPQIKSLEKVEDTATVEKESKDSVRRQISEGNKELKNAAAAFALIIDGKSLSHALQDDVKSSFIELATACASVICCRSSPKQKALVTRLVKEETKRTTLAIGDGANDVGMLQEADIGIGISGLEGMQAVMSSDIAIAQFRYLERLLLVHGHWCYRRITSMVCYFFYKNITFGFTVFLYEACTSFSGQTAYNDWFMSLYNVVFTSLPVIAIGVFDQDVSAKTCRKFPLLYQEGVQNALFGWRRIMGWMVNGLSQAIIIFFLCVSLVSPQAFTRHGPTAGRDILGATAYTSIICVVNLQLALSISYFTPLHHVLIWGSVALWFVFLVAFGALPVYISGDAHGLFLEALGPSPLFWAAGALLLVSALSPYFAFSSLQMRFFPMYHQMVQWLQHRGHTRDPAYVDMVRQRSIRRTTVGFTARRVASDGLAKVAIDCV